MTATQDMIFSVRLNIADTSGTVFDDDVVTEVIESYPIMDGDGIYPDEDGWVPTYDLNRASAYLWLRIASLYAEQFDFNADGASYSRSQKHKHALKMAGFFNSLSRAKSVDIGSQHAAD